MRHRDRILANLETLYRESYARAETDGQTTRMAELDNAYMRDQLIFEVLLDIRDLFAVAPAASAAESKTSSAIEKLETLRRITKLR